MANKNLNKAKEAKKDDNWKISTTSCGIIVNTFAVKQCYATVTIRV